MDDHMRKTAAIPIITLLSDFGLKDPYVAEMKAVILSINPQVRIVDVSHKIDKFNIRVGAFVLASAVPYFPTGSVHVAVVDPGVGTKRRPIIVETESGFYVGPDNGLLMLAAQREGISHVYHVCNERFMLPRVSRTFHGRDVFAPVAAHLTGGRLPSEFGPEIKDPVIPRFARPKVRKEGVLGEVLYIDGFGNLISNISAGELEKIGILEGSRLDVDLKGKTLALKLCSAYNEVPARKPLAIIGSSAFLEISINQENASEVFKVKAGDPVRVSLMFVRA